MIIPYLYVPILLHRALEKAEVVVAEEEVVAEVPSSEVNILAVVARW